MYDHLREHKLFPELAEAIAEHVDGGRAGHKATRLLSRDNNGFQLVGLIEGGDRVAYYEPIWRRIRSSPYSSRRVRGDRVRNDAIVESGQDVRDWLDDRDDVIWRHPRFRTADDR